MKLPRVRPSAVYSLLCAGLSHRSTVCGIFSSASAFQHPSAATPRRWRVQAHSYSSTSHSMAVSDDASVAATENPLSQKGLPSPLLLGSASFTRKLILSEMNIPFHKVVRPIDEKSLGDRSKDAPRDLVLTLARAKMDHLVQEIRSGNCAEDMPTNAATDGASEEWIVLTGDQVVTHNDNILEKPESIEEAKQFVEGYATSPRSTVGSCVLTHLPSLIQVSGVDTATIHFRPSLTGELVDRLLEEEAPVLSCAGGLMIEHPLVREHVERIDGTEDSVMGLSKELVGRLLDEMRTRLDDYRRGDN